MPTQASEDLWACEYCHFDAFRSYEEAKTHENECRKRQRPGSPRQQQQQQHPAVTTPYAPTSTAAHSPPSSSSLSISIPKRIALLGMEDRLPDFADTIACQNIEVFEVTQEQLNIYNQNTGGESSTISLGQVGLRCIHCVPGNAYSTTYPETMGQIARCVRLLADNHLGHCEAVPPSVRSAALQASTKRQKDYDERKPSTMEDDRNMMALVDHCMYFSRQVCLTDRYPPKTGVVFVNTAYRSPDTSFEQSFSYPGPSPPQQQQQQPPQQQLQQQHHQGTPYQPQHPAAPMMDAAIAATPLARRSKDRTEYPPPSYESDRPLSSAFQPRQQPPDSASRRPYMEPSPHGSATETPARAPRQEDPSSAQQRSVASASVASLTPQSVSHPQHESPYAQQPRHPSPYEMNPHQHTSSFPYFQDVSGNWFCRYCSHIHPQYRDQGHVWTSHSPPPPQFIDQHLSVCRSFHMPPSYPPQGYPPPYAYHTTQYGSYAPPPPHGWTSSPPAAARVGGQPPPHYPPENPYSSFHPHEAMHAPDPSVVMPSTVPQPTPSSSNVAAERPSSAQPDSQSDAVTREAIEILLQSDQRHFGTNPTDRENRGQLVLEEDKLLLTEYFFHLMRQLRLVRFTEADRKTRGGKRESIAIGYGGLQCVHCSEAPNSRKFFWSNVDRLANSFAEIPAHVLKCRHCPAQIKTALTELKKNHPQQMSKLPRGSQKVFFRRMWRRLHDDDPQKNENKENVEAVRLPRGELKDHNVGGSEPLQHATQTTSSPDHDSSLMVDRSTQSAAKALATSHISPGSSSRILLAIAEDKEWLSDMDCFIRQNLEVFCATAQDVKVAQEDRKYPVSVGQVGIRCIHCAVVDNARGAAVAFPYSINGVYESVREFHRLHLETCPNLPSSTKSKLQSLKGATSLSSVLRRYYVLAAQALGMFDTPEGIRSGGEPVPLGSNAATVFAFNDSRPSSRLSDHLRSTPVEHQVSSTQSTPLMSSTSAPPSIPPIPSSSGISQLGPPQSVDMTPGHHHHHHHPHHLHSKSLSPDDDPIPVPGASFLQTAVTPLERRKRQSLHDDEERDVHDLATRPRVAGSSSKKSRRSPRIEHLQHQQDEEGGGQVEV